MRFFFKQKTAYEMRISDWSSDVCSSDLLLASWPLIAATAPVNPATVEAKIIDSARSSRPWSTAPENHAGYTIGTCVMSPPLRTAATRLSQIGQAGSGTREPADRKSTRLNSSH